MGSDVRAEALSKTRLEGSRWRGGRLWNYKPEAPVLELTELPSRTFCNFVREFSSNRARVSTG